MKLSKLFVILGFLVFIGGGVQFLIMIRGAEGFSNLEGDFKSQIIYFLIYCISAAILVMSKHKLKLGFTSNLWFWLLLTWTCFSLIWSGEPQVTLRHIIALSGTTLFAILLVKFFDVQEYIHLLAISLLITIVASYFVIILLPNLGVSHIVGSEWRGIFTHKNHLGKAASLSILIFSYLLLSNQKGRWIWLFGLVAATGLLIGCQSAAAMIITIVMEAILIAFFLIDKAPKLSWASSLGLIVLVISVPLPTVDQMLTSIGKEGTLTGRTQLWDFSLDMALKKPLLGYGYGAFWLGSSGPSSQIGPESPMDLDVTHSHNGFIEIILDVGFIGLFLAFMAYLIATKKILKYFLRQGFSFKNSFFLLLLIWILPYNLTEQALLLRNSIFWVLFASIVMYQAKSELETR